MYNIDCKKGGCHTGEKSEAAFAPQCRIQKQYSKTMREQRLTLIGFNTLCSVSILEQNSNKIVLRHTGTIEIYTILLSEENDLWLDPLDHFDFSSDFFPK